MVNSVIDWWYSSTAGLFSLIVNQWLLAAFLFVSILNLITKLIVQLRNK